MYSNKKVLAIIPARGGSKRLPNKNILQLRGRPLIAWTIMTAIKSFYLDKIIVSTDSDQIASIGQEFGASIPFIRPDELATDTSSSFDVIIHAIDFYKSQGEVFDYIVLLQPTSPLRTTKDLNDAFSMINEETKCVVSVCATEHPPLWANTLPEDLNMKDFIKPELNNKRSQDLPVYYRLNGAIYISDVEYLIKHRGFWGEKTKAFIMPQERSIDIDSINDFKFCEILLQQTHFSE